MKVPFLNLTAQYQTIKDEIAVGLQEILDTNAFAGGFAVDRFEKSFAPYCQTSEAIGCGNGTDALWLALIGLGVGPGDTVITVPNTFIATAEAISICGATPLFVDCDEYYNLDAKQLKKLLEAESGNCRKIGRDEERKIGNCKEVRGQKSESRSRFTVHSSQSSVHSSQSSVHSSQSSVHSSQFTVHGLRLEAIIPVHLYGQPADMDGILAVAKEYGLAVVEDACQAHGATYKGRRAGSMGDAGCFSFYPGKNLGAYGEAGATVTNNTDMAKKMRMFRDHGQSKKYHHAIVGWNARMDGFQAAVLNVKMKYIEEWTRKRQQHAALYTELLSGVDGIETPKVREGVESVFHLYVIQTDNRDGLQEYLKENGIDTGLHYPTPLHLQEAYRHLGYKEGDFPVAERAAKRILSLPMFPELTEEQIRYVCDKIKDFQVHHGQGSY